MMLKKAWSAIKLYHLCETGIDCLLRDNRCHVLS